MYPIAMVRTQILLKERQYEALKSKARREGKSLSEVVREAVSAHIGDSAPGKKKRRLEDICGIWTDPKVPNDIAINHDKYLYGKP